MLSMMKDSQREKTEAAVVVALQLYSASTTAHGVLVLHHIAIAAYRTILIIILI